MARLLLMLLLMLLPGAARAADSRFLALCYHDVQDRLWTPDNMSVSTGRLVQHFEWLKSNGWQPVGLDRILAARNGGPPLPDKAVLLSFDDGYESLYTRVFPLLRQYGYPAVAGLVTSWLDAPMGSIVDYGDGERPREDFVTWDQVREMQQSGLVEFASHSHNLHHGEKANPQGNTQPAITTRIFDAGRGGYEPDQAWVARVLGDLTTSADIIEARTGVRPRSMVWPYGAYSGAAQELSARAGMPITLTLNEGLNGPEDLGAIRRILVEADVPIQDLAWQINHPGFNDPQRVVHVDLDYLYDPDPEQQARNLDLLITRIFKMHPGTVYLQAFADPDGDGVADALYFPNRHMPVRADLFNRVAWQLRTRAGVKVYAWMPVLAFRMAGTRVAHAPGGAAGYDRLSPFDPDNRRRIAEIYEDLGKSADFWGLLFHDDATLSDYEDASAPALAAYQSWGLPGDVAAIRASPALLRRWTEAKTRFLTDFTRDLAATVRYFRPRLRTARNMYAAPVMDKAAEAWFAQSLPDMLAAYDHVALMAMPHMEEATEPEPWLKKLVARVASAPGALDKVIFEMQARDWRNGRPVPGRVLAQWMMLVGAAGGKNWGYYPDDFITGRPALDEIRGAISLQSFPYLP